MHDITPERTSRKQLPYDLDDFADWPELIHDLDREELEILEDQVSSAIDNLEQELNQKRDLADQITSRLDELSQKEEDSEESRESKD